MSAGFVAVDAYRLAPGGGTSTTVLRTDAVTVAKGFCDFSESESVDVMGDLKQR